MSAPEKKEEGGEGEAKPKGKKKLIIIIVALVLIVAGAGVPLFLMGGDKKDKKEDEEPKEVEVVLSTSELDPFVVNLSEESSFLKVSILLEYDPSLLKKEGAAEGGGHGGGGEPAPKPGALPPEMEKRKPMIRDAVIKTLSSKKAADILTADGKDNLKQELLEVINEAIGLDESPVVGIYFTEFIVQ